MYSGWDVHSYTKDFNYVLDRNVQMRKILSSPCHLSNDNFLQLIKLVKLKLRRHYNSDMNNALIKIQSRSEGTKYGYFDPDLQINCTRLFVELISLLNNDCNFPENWTLLADCLKDVGSTCIQGDSHRLLSLYIALLRSINKIK